MPKFDIFSGAFVITFFKRRVNEGVNEGVKTLYKYIESNPGKRTTEMSLALNIPPKTIERWIKNLKTENKIVYKGSSKTGGYFIIK